MWKIVWANAEGSEFELRGELKSINLIYELLLMNVMFLSIRMIGPLAPADMEMQMPMIFEKEENGKWQEKIRI
jgi:hypothetical protein